MDGQLWCIADHPASCHYGGTLLSRLPCVCILHCNRRTYHFRTELEVLLGYNDLAHGDSYSQTIVASASYMHPNYNENTMYDDIALIKLPSPVTLGDGIRTICLPKATETFTNRTVPLAATGWGHLTDGGQSPTILQEVLLRSIPTGWC